mmetsp:Transcript_29536/g.77369  ORF Transcript_29536/g.77369 Transcript_29536/m.77369 type:complete len:303 (+) Transcript_29536:97-1005(+)
MEIFFLANSAQYFSGTPSFLSCAIFWALILSSCLRSVATVARTALPSSRKSRRSWYDFSSRATIWRRSSWEWSTRLLLSSACRWRSAPSCSICTLIIRSNSSLSNLACSPRRRSFSACCSRRASASSLFMASCLSLWALSLILAARSAASVARFARRASISEALSAAFSCMARRRAVSASFSAATRSFSASISLSRSSLASLYSMIFCSSSLSANILSSLIFIAALLTACTSASSFSPAIFFWRACSASSTFSASICFSTNPRSWSRMSSSRILCACLSLICSMITFAPLRCCSMRSFSRTS